VDLLPTEDLGRSNARALVGDITDPTVRAGIAEALHGSADVVLADLAPKLSGIAATDSARHAGLVEAALEAAVGWLAPEGTFVAKLFMDSEYQALVTRLRAAFRSVKTRRPETTRRGSAEIYAVCRELRG
jgi:23S rRNA (uridine2552-2'-O)-methyltransferase